MEKRQKKFDKRKLTRNLNNGNWLKEKSFEILE